MPKKPATERAPVDSEDDDRRLAPQVDLQPLRPTNALTGESSAQQDEHRGLAARILDLRNLVEEHRRLQLKEHHALVTKVATIEQGLTQLEQRVDREVTGIQRLQRDLQQQHSEGAEQVRQAGQLARKMTDGMKELEELRAVASDPHEVVKPVQRALAHLRADVESLTRSIDVRFEQMPKARTPAYEARSEDEGPIVKLGAEIRKLKERVKELEAES